ncbi:flavodoxin family protein [Clostridium sp.]|uniref:flavodoxin family protein n=1 Tax=Clostridium sp. TaxID=1506 RepID=UPI00260EAB71|nr:flavodoxin family protein [Clostridium sp.]
MKVIILSGTPKNEGLCHSCITAAVAGAEKAGAGYEVIKLNDYKLDRCKMCGDGWGICRERNICAFGEDGFTEIQKKIADADAIILDTPVYWGEMTEVMKTFFDRFRRCEALKGQSGAMAGKSVLLIASPGGSGNGMISCLEQMERLCRHLQGNIFDFIGVNRWNKDYKMEAITEAVAAMASKTE